MRAETALNAGSDPTERLAASSALGWGAERSLVHIQSPRLTKSADAHLATGHSRRDVRSARQGSDAVQFASPVAQTSGLLFWAALRGLDREHADRDHPVVGMVARRIEWARSQRVRPHDEGSPKNRGGDG